jgi:UDP-N-acetylglucosamine acyltransferase
MIHGTAVIEQGAELDAGVEVGPYCVVGAGARIGKRTVLMAHAVIAPHVILGEENVVHPFAVIGGPPQAKRFAGGIARTRIGDRNVIREHVTVHGGMEGRVTTIGDGNLLMVGSHVAHDVQMGSSCVVANGVQLAGHAVVEDHVTFGGLAGVGQFVRIGEGAFVAAGAMVERDVPPFVIVQGDRARVRALNVVGLRRRGVPEQQILALRKVYRALFVGKKRLEPTGDPMVNRLIAAVQRGEAKDSPA